MQAAAERLRQEQEAWQDGEHMRQAAAARADTVVEREAALQRDLARLVRHRRHFSAGQSQCYVLPLPCAIAAFSIRCHERGEGLPLDMICKAVTPGLRFP